MIYFQLNKKKKVPLMLTTRQLMNYEDETGNFRISKILFGTSQGDYPAIKDMLTVIYLGYASACTTKEKMDFNTFVDACDLNVEDIIESYNELLQQSKNVASK